MPRNLSVLQYLNINISEFWLILPEHMTHHVTYDACHIHVTHMQCLCDCQMTSMCYTCDTHTMSIWRPCASHVKPMWHPYNVRDHVIHMWYPCDTHTMSISRPCATHVIPMWHPYNVSEDHVINMLCQCDIHMNICDPIQQKVHDVYFWENWDLCII